MGFIPPLNLGQFQPSPATLSQWIYQIWQFLQENPIATEADIREYIQSELSSPEMLADAINAYLAEHPPASPVQSVQGKTGAVQLAYNDIVVAGNNVPVYRAAEMPAQNVLQGQYAIGFRFFANTTTNELYVIKPDGAPMIVGRGVFDGTTIDLDSTEGETTIAEGMTEISRRITTLENDSKYNAGDVISDNSIKLGYCQSGGTAYPNNSQIVFNVNLPKGISSDVKGITFNSGPSVVIRCGGSRIPENGGATINETTNWAYVSAVVNKELGIVRITCNIPKDANVEQKAATLVGTVTFTFTGSTP